MKCQHKPYEGQQVMIQFMYMGKVTWSPATYTEGRFIIPFYTSEYPVDSPISWEPRNND